MLSFAGSAPRRAQGKFPSLSINRDGMIVEVHQHSTTSTTMYYQVGTLNRNDVNFYEERQIVEHGKFPKVSINDDNHVVEVHEAVLTRRIFYNVGPLNNQRGQWQRRPILLSPGRFPAVAVHGNRVVITHDRAYFRYSTYYHVGIINAEGTAIEWGNKLPLFDTSGITKTTVTVNEEFAVAAGRGWFHIVCRVGRFPDKEARNIQWFNETPLDYIGICPTICLDGGGCVIMVWHSSLLRHLTYAEGEIKQNGEQRVVEWQESRNYDYGHHPTIAITPNNGQVVEEHETNFGHTLHLHIGRYDRQHNGGPVEEEAPLRHENPPDEE